EHEVVAYRCNRIQPGFTELALHVVFGGKTIAAVGVKACVGGLPGCIRRQQFGHIGLRTARRPALEEPRRLESHQIRGLEMSVSECEGELHTLICTDGASEDDSFPGILGPPLNEPTAIADRFRGDEDALCIPSVDNVAKSLSFVANQVGGRDL